MEAIDIFQRLGVALGIGFLVGVERGWKQRFEREGARVAGLRTYTLIGLLGGIASLPALGDGVFMALTIVFGLAWIVYKLWETWTDGDVSITGLVAGVLVFALGAYAVRGSMQVAAAGGVFVVAVLAFKEAAHDWLQKLTWAELRSAILILAATLIALPILPRRALDPYGAFNPGEIWLLTILIAGIGFASYAALRVLGPRLGLYFGAALGAMVSSTIVTLDLARRTSRKEIAPLAAAAGAAIANAIMFARVGALVAIFAAPALSWTIPALAAAIGVSIAGAGALVWLSHRDSAPSQLRSARSPLDLIEVARLAAVLAAVTAIARIVAHFHGDEGIMLVSALAGLVDVDAVALAVGGLVRDELAPVVGAQAILLAAAVDTISKTLIAIAAGRPSFAAPYAAASALALGAGAATFVAL